MIARFSLIASLALLGACGGDKDPTTVTIRAGEDGNAQITAEPGEESRLKIDTDGFKADVRVPGLGMLANKMEIDGVKLYPGSKVAGVNIEGGRGREDGRFAMRFDAPAGREPVGDWFGEQFSANDFTARKTPTGYAGTKKDGDWFTLDLTGTPDGHTLGEFRLGKRQAQ